MKHKIPDFLCATFFLTCLLAFECRLNCKMDWSKDWLKFLIKVIPVSMLHRARNWRVISKVYYGQFCSNIAFWWGECRDPCNSHRSDLDQKRRQNVLRTLMTEIRDPRSVRQSQIRFRPEKASKCAKNTNDRDPRSEIRATVTDKI